MGLFMQGCGGGVLMLMCGILMGKGRGVGRVMG